MPSCWLLKHPFIPFLWAAGSIGAKEIVKQCGLLNLLEEGNPVMSDKGFLISDIISFKKVFPISPANWRGPRLLSKGTTDTNRFASLRHKLKETL